MAKKVQVGDFVECELDSNDSWCNGFTTYRGIVTFINVDENEIFINVDNKYFYQGVHSDFKYRIKRAKRFGPWIKSRTK